MKTFALLFLAVAASGCPDIKTDPSEESPKGPTVEFDPANKIVPFPNNLLLDPMTGKVALPAQCGESPTAKALREGVLNKLDGFGTFETAMTVTFTEPVDAASLTSSVVMYKRASGNTAADPKAAQKVPVVVQLTKTPRFDADCANPVMVDQAVIIPRIPLDQRSTYVVAIVEGAKAASGDALQPSFTWSLVRSAENPAMFDDNGNYISDRTPLDPNIPAQLEQLKGINLLWNAHAAGMAFLKGTPEKIDPTSVLLSWNFNTQTTTDPLDPAVATSPAAKIVEGIPAPMQPLLGNQSVAAVAAHTGGGAGPRNPPFDACPDSDNDVQCFLKITLGARNYTVGNATCASVGCDKIADVLGSVFVSKQYQVDTPNPYTGTGALPIPGPWADAVSPTMVKSEQIRTLSFVPVLPATAPVVVFQHGLGRAETDAFAIGSQLASAGFATVAMDAVGHGSRAIRVSSAGPCADDPNSTRPDKGPDPTGAVTIACYAPFLSPNLAATRDGIRQTVLDHQRLISAVKACGTTACGALKVDPAHIVYMGQSLGGIIGSVTNSVSADLKAGVLNVPGVGWADVLENTASLAIRCSLVDGLIAAGILTGDKSNFMVMPPTGLCTTDAWKAQPGYRQFSVIGRWILDPADPANFTRKLAAKRILIQKVDGDQVVPNVATNNEGALVGLMEVNADCGNPPPPLTPSAAITTNPMTNKFLKYLTVAPGTAGCLAGNTFAHGSLLSPGTPATTAGTLATARMQTDAIFFLLNNH